MDQLFPNDCPVCQFPVTDPVTVGGVEYCRDCAPEVTEPEYGVQERPYQAAAREGIFQQLAENDSTLAVLPTGTGKTVIFASVIERWPAGRTIVMAHRDELIRQGCDKITRFTGIECDIEMGDYRADQCALHQRAPVVVTSVQTMSKQARMNRFRPEDFTLLVIDEGHHATAPTYQAVINHFRQNPLLKVLGVTATPDRTDEAALGQIFKTVAYEYQIVQAIEDGWLVPIEQQFVQVDGLDLSDVKTTAGDLNQGQLGKILEQEKILHGYAWPTIELSKGEQTLVFTASVDQAEKLSDIFNRHQSGCSEWICGDQVKTPMDRRRQILKSFSNGNFQFLVNCGVLLEGYDEPNIKCVAVARPTKSRSLYAQIVGRGTRPLAGLVDGRGLAQERRAAIQDSGKPSLLVLDFVGNSGRHKLIHTGDILGGDYSDEIIAAATTAVRAKSDRGERANMLDELRHAEERRREELKRRMAVTAKAMFKTARIDPFAVYDILPKREPGWFQGKKPTVKQIECLAKFGIPTNDLTFCQASQLIDKAIDRRKKNLCTFKQAKLLGKHGFPTDVTFDIARQTIDRIAASGWKLMNTT